VTDLVTRARVLNPEYLYGGIAHEMADEIERLRVGIKEAAEEIERLQLQLHDIQSRQFAVNGAFVMKRDVMTERAEAVRAERDRCIRAIKNCPSWDTNGYICTKDAAIKAILNDVACPECGAPYEGCPGCIQS
jgi:hypothetical protein